MVCFSSIYIVSVNRVRRNHPQHTHNHIRNFNFFMFHLLLFFSKRFKYASTSFVKSVPFLLAYLCASSKRYLSNVSAFVSILCPIMMLYIANLIIKFETNKQKLSIFQTSSSCHLPKLQSAIAFNMLLVCSNAIEALSSHTVADCVKFFVRSLAQRWAWSFAVDGVYHHF